jgi:hypothetical protein
LVIYHVIPVGSFYVPAPQDIVPPQTNHNRSAPDDITRKRPHFNDGNPENLTPGVSKPKSDKRLKSRHDAKQNKQYKPQKAPFFLFCLAQRESFLPIQTNLTLFLLTPKMNRTKATAKPVKPAQSRYFESRLALRFGAPPRVRRGILFHRGGRKQKTPRQGE